MATTNFVDQSTVIEASWLNDVNASVYGVKDAGAKGDGSTDDTVAIQAAIDAAAANSGGFVHFPSGTYITSGLTLKSGVILKGDGMNSTILKQADNADTYMINSVGFGSLTGLNCFDVDKTNNGVTGTRTVAQAVDMPHGFGLMDIQLNGNKDNQSGGNGVQFYGKRIMVEHVLIRDCFGVGWYSEAGDYASQAAGWEDLPESNINSLFCRNNGSHGIQFRGPHDTYMNKVISNANGGDGLLIQRSAQSAAKADEDAYSGSCDINFAHVYANSGIGIHADTSAVQFRGQQLISESNSNEGLVIKGGRCEVSMLQLYNNHNGATNVSATITGITKADPARVTSTAHGLSDGDIIYISGVSGMTNVNDQYFEVDKIDDDTFDLVGVDSTSFSTYTSGGTAEQSLFEMLVPGNYNTIKEIQIKNKYNQSGILITGTDNELSGVHVDGVQNSDGTGSSGEGIVSSGGKRNRITGRVFDFDDTGGSSTGLGLLTNIVQDELCTYDLIIDDCATLWKNENIGKECTYRLRGSAESGQTAFAGSGPNANEKEMWDVLLDENGTAKRSRNQATSGGTFDISSTDSGTMQTITVNHELLTTPDFDDISFGLKYTGADSTLWSTDKLYIQEVSSTQITFKAEFTSTLSGTFTANVVWKAHL